MKYFLIILFSISYLYSNEIKFSTLLLDRTSNIEIEYKDMLNYLQKESSYKFSFVFNTGYEDLVYKFGKQEIDIVALDALEYVKLKRFFPYAKAFISFYDKKKNKFYTCDAVTKNQKIKNLSNISKDIKLRLLNSYSTCGYDMIKYLLIKNNKNIESYETSKLGYDDDIILEILLNEKDIGFEKSNTIEKYDFFKFHTIKSNLKIPALALIVNTHTVSEDITKIIQNILLSLKPLENKNDSYIVRNWNFATQNGSFIPDEKEYLHLYEILYEIENIKDKK